MTEKWQRQLEQLDRLSPSGDLVDRALENPARQDIPAPGRRVGAIVVAGLLTAALATGSYVALRDKPPATVALQPAPVPADAINGDFLFARSDDDGWHIYALDPDTEVERQLSDGVRDYGSDWSPDGTKIVYDSETGSGYDIVVADAADGSNAVTIAQGEVPAWSPDGTRIAYSGEDGAIWVVGADGSDAHAVTQPPPDRDEDVQPHDWHAAWSPDGRSIAYTRVFASKYVPMPSGGQTNVTLEELRVWSEAGTDVALTDAYTYLGEIDWSPDGSTLVFSGAPTLFHEATTRGDAWPRVMTIAVSGGDAIPISPELDETWVSGATWSPDGRWIAYQQAYDPLVMVRPDGSDRSEIPLGYEVIGLSWGVRPPAPPATASGA